MPDVPREMIDEGALEAFMLALLWVGPLVGLLAGALVGAFRRVPPALAMRRGLVIGLVGPLVWLLWRVFSWLTRFEIGPTPEQDYFGLERVDVLVGLVVLFVASGALLGWLWPRLWGSRESVHKLDIEATHDGTTPSA